jgi:tetratricopeptide (TPR) repeat protein
MKRQNYPQVIPFLDQAIERAKDRSLKARYSYIIAQLHDQAGRVAEAAAYYQKCLDFSNKYEMEFNTQLSIIRSSVKNKSMTRSQAQESLEKMIKDSKNVDYHGRIYFLMATLAVEENDVPLAIGFLEKSVSTVGKDIFQQIESYYLLATLYMKQLQYVEAEQAFKSCAAVMKPTDIRYKSVKKLADNLRDIALNLNTIKLQDSLLVLSYMTDDQLKELAKEIKKQKQKEAEEAALKSKVNIVADKRNPPVMQGIDRGGVPSVRQVGGSQIESIFWAYDQKNLKKTRREFDKTWRDIPLTDYWRVQSKASQFASTAETPSANATAAVDVYKSEIEDYFKSVPKNDSTRAISHAQIRKSMLLLGGLYRDRLEDFSSSIKMLESLLRVTN